MAATGGCIKNPVYNSGAQLSQQMLKKAPEALGVLGLCFEQRSAFATKNWIYSAFFKGERLNQNVEFTR